MRSVCVFAEVEPQRVCTSIPKEDKDSYSFRVEGGLCNPGYYSFVSLAKGASAGYFLGLNDKLQGVCADKYKAPSSDVVLLSPAEAQAKPQSATWMLVDKDDMSGVYVAKCGGTWGLTVLLVLGVGGCLYVGGGIAYGKRAKGSSGPPLEAHPHFTLWQELGAMTMDGVAFSRARLQGRSSSGGAGGGRSSGYERLSPASGGGKSRNAGREREREDAEEEAAEDERSGGKRSKGSGGAKNATFCAIYI
jgi:hypothetical protein